jgi:hypothetical protein
MSLSKTAGFGIVTVMNVDAYTGPSAVELEAFKTMTPNEILEYMTAGIIPDNITTLTTEKTTMKRGETGSHLCYLDHLQTSTLTTSGPDITISGGQYKNPLIKFGKSCRCEITDALGQKDALVALGGAEEDDDGDLSITERFPGPITMVGDIFLIDQKTGDHIKCQILMYQFLPDAVPSFSFDMNNAATFALNGDLLSTEVNNSKGLKAGVFYSIIGAFDAVQRE